MANQLGVAFARCVNGYAAGSISDNPGLARRHSIAILIAVLFVFVSLPTEAVPAEAVPMFMGLGVPDQLTENDFIRDSVAFAISADGSTVVGEVTATLPGIQGISISNDDVATRWTQADGHVFIALPPIAGVPANDFPGRATDVSGDGSVIIGRTELFNRQFQFSEPAGVSLLDLQLLSVANFNGISNDGSTIVGNTSNFPGPGAFRLTSAGVERLANPAGEIGAGGRANAASADGSVVVGLVSSDAENRATRWDASGTPTLAPSADAVQAFDVTPDGSVVVGSGPEGAFRWDTVTNTVVILDSIFGTPNKEAALAVSADGSRIVGNSGGIQGFSGRGVLWDENNDIHEIRALLTEIGLGADIVGWSLGTIVDISADGRTIVGNGENPAGDEEAWIAVVENIPVVLPDPDIFWVNANGDGLWHSDIGGQTNWEDNEEEPVTPPGADGTAVVGIDEDSVTLNGTPPGLAVTSIASLNASGSLTLNAPLSIGGLSGAENVTINNALTTENKLFLSGSNTWQSGTVSGGGANVASGVSAMMVDGDTTTFLIEGGDKSLDTNLTLKNGASATQSDGILTISNGAALTIDPGTAYFIEADKIISGPAIVNKGEFSKGALDNEVTIEAPFTNQNGTISASEGTLNFTGTQSHRGGTYEASAGATIQFSNTLTAVGDTVTASGGGNVALVGGTYSVNNAGTATFNLSGPEGLDIQGATVEATGPVTNRGKATFQSGVLEGGNVSADQTLFEGGFVNALNGTFVIAGGNLSKQITGIVQNNGSITQQENTTLRTEDGGVIFNHTGGTYEASGPQITISGNNGRFENTGGMLETSRGAATPQTPPALRINVPLNVSNGGIVKVNQGTTLISEAGIHTGTGKFDIAGFLVLGRETHIFDGNFSIEGAGETRVLSVVLAGGQVVSKVDLLRFDFTDSSITSTGGTLVIEGGMENDQSGSFDWDLGTISATNAPPGTDALINRGGQVLIEPRTFNTTPVLSHATMRNTDNGVKQGTVTQNGDLELENGVIINDNGGVWRSEAFSENTIFDRDAASRFVNSGGTFIKTGSETAKVRVRFDLNKGTVRVDEGTLSLVNGSESGISEPFATGDFQVAAGATLEMKQGFRFDGIYEATGEGTFLISGENVGGNNTNFEVLDLFTLNLAGPGKAVLDGNLVGGQFDGQTAVGLLVNKGNVEWHGGLLDRIRNDPGGTWKITSGIATSLSKQIARNFDNRGVINHELSATVDIGRDNVSRTLTNTGVYNLRGQLSLVDPTHVPLTFLNQAGGQIRLAEPNVQRRYDGQFINHGLVEAVTGSTLWLLDLPDNFQTLNGDPNGLLANGRWIANANSKIRLGGVNARKLARNEANITLRGDGRITNLPDADAGDAGLDFENGGTLRLLESTIFSMPGDFLNAGTLEVDATSALLVAGDFRSESGSNVTVNNLLTAQGFFFNNGGITSGSGRISSSVYNNIAGTINPGNSPGTMTIMSDYTHGVAAILEAEIGGLVAGVGHDQLIIDGDATILGGTLSLLLFDGFGPEMGQTFDVMTADTIGGAFDTIDQPLFLDEPVFGVSVVDLLGSNQQALRVTALQTVPEPSTLVVFVMGLFALFSYRRRTGVA